MKAFSSDRTGILIVRLWNEADERDGLRARITQTLDSVIPDQARATASTPEEIYSIVRAWVEAFTNPN